MRWPGWLVAGAMVASAALLAAPGNKRLNAGAVTMTVWGMPFEDRLFLDVYARGWERANPGVTVDYQRHSELASKYNAWHARGLGAEVMRIRVTEYHQMVARGMLEPLSKYIDSADPEIGMSEAQKAAFPKALVEALRIDGELYALPEDNAQYGLYYNREIFDAYNAAHPNDRVEYPNAEWTWEDLRAAARKLTVRNERGELKQRGIDMAIWAWPFLNFYGQAGGELFTADGLTTLVDGEAGVATLHLFRDLITDGSWTPYFGRQESVGPNMRFANGETAMYLDGTWICPSIELTNPKLDFAVAPVPRGKTRAVVCGSVLWGISSRAANKEAGWKMIRWLTDYEQALAYWQILRVAPPAHLGVVNSEAFKETTGVPDPVRAGRYLVPPMPRERYEDRAAWMAYAVTPREDLGGRAPGFVPAGPYQSKLEMEIQAMLPAYLGDPARREAREALRQVAQAVHDQIDRDRIAARLPRVERAGTTQK